MSPPQPARRPRTLDKSIPTNRWVITRRVAFDADEEEKGDVTSTKPVSPNNPASKITMKATTSPQATHCSPQNRSSSDNEVRPPITMNQDCSQTPEAVSLARPPRHSPSTDNLTGQEATVRADANDPVKVCNDVQNNSEDQWIIAEPDRSSRWHQGYFGRWIKLWDGRWFFQYAQKQPWKLIHARQRKSIRPRTTFQSLPPEIRNTIYNYVVPESSVLIVRSRPIKEIQSMDKNWTDENVVYKQSRSRLMHQPEADQPSGEFEDSMSLLLTCSAVRREVETYLYSRTFFHFHALKALRKFLSTTSREGIRSIRQLSIRQTGYGNPELSDRQECRRRYYGSWEKTCTQLGEMTPSLRHLKLVIHDREWPCVLSGKDFHPAWATALTKIAPGLLPKVEVRVYHAMIDANRNVLKDLSRRIEDMMMNQAGREERDREETHAAMLQIAARQAARAERELKKKAKRDAPPPPTELIISMADVVKQAGIQAAVGTSKVRSKGLDKFYRINTTEMDV